MTRARACAALLATVLLSFECAAQEPTFKAPEGWLESATDSPVECPEGLQPRLTNREYRKYAIRNEVWAQASIDNSDWRAGAVIKKPALQYPKGVHGIPNPLRIIIHVLVGEKGIPLDAVVTCSNVPTLDEAFLGLVTSFKFRPTRYKDRQLVTNFPIDFIVPR